MATRAARKAIRVEETRVVATLLGPTRAASEATRAEEILTVEARLTVTPVAETLVATRVEAIPVETVVARDKPFPVLRNHLRVCGSHTAGVAI